MACGDDTPSEPTVCDEAAEILSQCRDDIEPLPEGDPGECTGQAITAARCIRLNRTRACAWLDGEDAAISDCISDNDL